MQNIENSNQNPLSFDFLSFHPPRHKVQLIDQNMVRVPQGMATSLFGGKHQVYSTLLLLDLFLPDENSKGCTTEYLFGVVRKDFFFILQSEIRPPVVIKSFEDRHD